METYFYVGDPLRSLFFQKENRREETLDMVSDIVAYFDSS